MDIAPILSAAFSKPGAILIGYDRSCDEYEFGIQQPRQHKRFLNVFRHGDAGAIYFKHDPATVHKLYAQHPDSILPSEIAPKYWSRAMFRDNLPMDIYIDPICRSYELVAASLTKKGKALLEGIADQEMRFPLFHKIAMEYASRSNTYAQYTDDAFGGPCISVGVNRVVRYTFNSLVFACEPDVLGEISSIKLDGATTVTADVCAADWDVAIRRALDDALAH